MEKGLKSSEGYFITDQTPEELKLQSEKARQQREEWKQKIEKNLTPEEFEEYKDLLSKRRSFFEEMSREEADEQETMRKRSSELFRKVIKDESGENEILE